MATSARSKYTPWLMILLSIAIALYAVAFQLRLAGAPAFHARFDEMPLFRAIHVIGGAVVLLVGGSQFLTDSRRSRPELHRWLGRLHLSSVLIGGIGGLVMARFSEGGLVAHFGFGTLAVLWLVSG